MIFAEMVALFAVIVSGGIGASFVVSLIKRMNLEGDRKVARAGRMLEDLGAALRSHDYRQLDDWLVLYSDAEPGMRAHVKQRRDELYIEITP